MQIPVFCLPISLQLYRKTVQQMTQTLIRKLTTLSQYEEALAKINSSVTDRLTVLKTKPQSIQRDILTICSDPFTLAQQLTHIELVSGTSSVYMTLHSSPHCEFELIYLPNQ